MSAGNACGAVSPKLRTPPNNTCQASGYELKVPDPVFKFFSLSALRVDPLDKTVYLGSGEHKTAPEVETGELTADAVAAQLTIADLQQVADLAHFKDRRTAKHIPVPFHIGDILADLSDDFQNLIESFHNRVAVGFRRKDAMTE